MAEFCLECWNRLNDAQDTQCRYVISKGTDLCEGCAQYKRVIVKERMRWRIQRKIAVWVEGFNMEIRKGGT